MSAAHPSPTMPGSTASSPSTGPPGAMRRPPGPRGLPFLGTSFMASRQPTEKLASWFRKYGDIVYYHFAKFRVYVLFHPEHVEQVLLGRSGDFVKGMTSRASPELFGNGLLTSDGEFWRRQRKLSNPAFHRGSIERYAAVTIKEACRMLDSWRNGEVRNIHNEMMNVTLRIVLRSLFGSELGDSMRVIEPALDTIMVSSSGMKTMLTYLGVPTLAHRRYIRAVKQIDEVVYELIARGREKLARSENGTDGPKDFLTLLLEARDDDGNAMSDQQLRDEVITLLLAGHETSALALSWAWFLLAQNPETERRLHQELDSVLGSRPPNAGDLPKLVYTERVIREVLRLYPPAWRIFRMTQTELQIGDYVLPAGSNIVLVQWVTQRDPRWFVNPDKFEPDRWVEDAARKLPRFAYFPFGGGPRVCIGAGFAMMEATLLLAAIAQRYRIRLRAGERVEPLATITLRPKKGIAVVLEERERFAAALGGSGAG